MTIRLRLTIWYFFINLSFLLIFSIVIQQVMRGLIYSALDRDLNIMADTIEKSYDPFFREFAELNITPETANRFDEYYLVVYNSRGEPIFRSPMARLISLQIPLTQDNTIKSYISTLKIARPIPFIHPDKNGAATFKVISRKLLFYERPLGWIVVGLPFQWLKSSMAIFQRTLFVAIVLVVFLIGVGGYFLIQRALNPVNLITQKANAISHSNLDERIQVENPADELGQLTITLNNLLARLQNAFASQTQFLADAAHELKTPLAILRAHWENELNNPRLSLEIKTKLVQDVETIGRLSSLINHLLLLSQTELKASNFQFESVSLDGLLNEIVSDAVILAEPKSQRIEIAALVQVRITGDKNRLYQLFFNLIDNAIKYTQEGGQIHISLKKTENMAQVEISDNGPGISAADLPYIFDRFYRVQKDRSLKTGGSGLGLAISKLIAEVHQGAIQVKSEIGVGSTFTVVLPFERKTN